jgi:hypothetical protein
MRIKDLIRDCISNDKNLADKVRAYLKENRKLMMMKNLQDF